MSDTQNYKVVTFRTSDSSLAASVALMHYHDFVKREIARNDDYSVHWNRRLAEINLAMADFDAGVLS